MLHVYCHAKKSRYPGGHCHTGVSGLADPNLHAQPCASNWDYTSSDTSYVRHSPYWHPQSGTHSSCSSLIPSTESRIAPPVVYLMIDLARRPMLKLQRPMSAVATALHKAKGNHPKQHQRHSTMTQLPWGVLENMTVRTKLTTVVTSPTKRSQGRMQLIPILNWPLGIVSLAQTLRRWSLEQHKRGFERKSKPLAELLGAVSGLSPTEVNTG